MLAIIFDPKRDNNRLGSQIFYYQEPNPNPRDKEVRLKTVVLSRKDVNFIDPIEWDGVTKHAPNKPVIDKMTRQGIITIYPPETEDVSNSTLDYKDLEVVRHIINTSTNPRWLERCRVRDNRKEVDSMISERLTELSESVLRKKEWAMAGGAF